MRKYILFNDTRCFPLELAYTVSKILPRGKGAFSRLIGKIASPWIHHSFRTRHGALLPIVPYALDVFVSMKQQENSWDYWVFRVLNKATKRGNVVYDIGANVGYITVELANLRKMDDVTLVAFEPQKKLAENIRLASQFNGLKNIIVMEYAVGAENRIIQFREMSHSVHATAVQSVKGFKRSVNIEQVSIDDLLAKNKIPPPDVIKIDIEGYEYEALKGMILTIQKFRPIVIFEISYMTKVAGYSARDFEELLGNCGEYSYYSLGGKNLNLKSLIVNINKGENADVVAIPLDRNSLWDINS
jgi:FkbM family methyltransferase